MASFMDGGFGAALNGATSLFGMIGQNQQYKRQLRMMREQNEFNKQERIAAQNWQRDMWNLENSYNTASAQRQRLEAAGLNPYMMMNGGDAGIASSSSSSPMATGAATPQAPNPMEMLSPLQQAFSQMAQLVQQDKQISSQIDVNNSQIGLNNSNVALNSIRGLQLDSLKEWQNRQRKRIDEILPYETELMTAQANAQRSQQRLNDANAQLAYTQDFGQVLKNNLSQKELENFDANFIASTGLKYAQAVEAMASAGASEAMARKYIADAIGTEFWNKINSKNKDEIEKNFVSNVKAERARKNLERYTDEHSLSAFKQYEKAADVNPFEWLPENTYYSLKLGVSDANTKQMQNKNEQGFNSRPFNYLMWKFLGKK